MAEKKSRKTAAGGTSAKRQTRRRGNGRAESDADARDTILDAFMVVVAEKGWRATTLTDIATQAGVSLSRIRRNYDGKADLLTDFMKRTDERVLERLADLPAEDSPHDRLFDIMMMRLETLEPHRDAIRSLLDEMAMTPEEWSRVMAGQCTSQRWMLAGAGIESTGLRAAIRIGGLGFVFARTLRVWVDDEPDLARTMAELDRRLRRGEQTLGTVEAPLAMAAACMNFAAAVLRAVRSRRSRSPADPAE